MKRDILWRLTISTYFRLTYTCVLRPGEGRNLKLENIDFSTGEIQIIDSKWHKSRTVVMSEDILVLMKKYASIRKNHRPDSEYLKEKRQELFHWSFRIIVLCSLQEK